MKIFSPYYQTRKEIIKKQNKKNPCTKQMQTCKNHNKPGFLPLLPWGSISETSTSHARLPSPSSRSLPSNWPEHNIPELPGICEPPSLIGGNRNGLSSDFTNPDELSGESPIVAMYICLALLDFLSSEPFAELADFRTSAVGLLYIGL